MRSFTPISRVATAPFLVLVHPSIPARSLRELIKLAKAKPGELNFGAGNGTPPHLAGEMFKTAASVNLVHVPYKVSALATTDFVAGQTQVMFQQLATLEQYIQAGKIRALAVASARRHPQLPGIPTTGESGLPDLKLPLGSGWWHQQERHSILSSA